MSPYASMRISSILPGAISRVEQLAKRVRERELAEAIREANQGPPKERWHCNGTPRSAAELELRIADFENKLQHRIGRSSRQVRDRHLVVKNWLVLPSEETRWAVEADPGLHVEGSWDGVDDRIFSLVRLDAGCAFCGRTFELSEDGSVIGGDPPGGPQRALSAISKALSLPPGRIEVSVPSGTAACPHCGWRAILDNRAKALGVELSEQCIKVGNHPVDVPSSAW